MTITCDLELTVFVVAFFANATCLTLNGMNGTNNLFACVVLLSVVLVVLFVVMPVYYFVIIMIIIIIGNLWLPIS